MSIAVFVIIAALTLYAPHAVPHPSPSPGLRLPSIRSSDLYAARSRRRVASLLRLRLLELRKAGLERAADVIERRLPVERLLAPER